MYIENLECAVYVSAVPNMDRSCLQSRKMDRATHGLVCRGMSSRWTQTREWVFATSVKIYLVRPFSMVPLCNGAGSVVRRESHSPHLKSYRIQELNNAKHVKLFAEAWRSQCSTHFTQFAILDLLSTDHRGSFVAQAWNAPRFLGVPVWFAICHERKAT